MDVSKEKQLANEMADYCRKLADKPIIPNKPWKNFILRVVMAALVGGAVKPDGNWGGIPKN